MKLCRDCKYFEQGVSRDYCGHPRTKQSELERNPSGRGNVETSAARGREKSLWNWDFPCGKDGALWARKWCLWKWLLNACLGAYPE